VALISCIVPVFNGERYLREALDSILAQTYRPLEIIVVDDGSTDGSAEVVASYGDQVRYVRQREAGPAATRNRGLSLAKGAFVAFLDQDDIWHPEKLVRQMARFEIRPELDLCVTHIQNFWTSELKEEQEQYRDHPRAQPVPGYTTTTLLARSTCFDTVGQFNTALQFADAMDWFLRVARHGAVVELLADVLVYHRIHKTNLTRRFAAASRDEFLRIVKASLDRRRDEGELPGIPASSGDETGKPVWSA
jgi:glycosyltransferase involved in cell wall biosynthesis